MKLSFQLFCSNSNSKDNIKNNFHKSKSITNKIMKTILIFDTPSICNNSLISSNNKYLITVMKSHLLR